MPDFPYDKLSDGGRFRTALTSAPDFAAKIGVMIATFANVESYLPFVFAKLTGVKVDDAHAIVGVFRAFSNKIDLLAEVIKRRDKDSLDWEVFTHIKGRFTEANRIRNHYAHAMYMGIGDPLTIVPYSGDHNKIAQSVEKSFVEVEADLIVLETVANELWAFTEENRLPAKLHARLMKRFPPTKPPLRSRPAGGRKKPPLPA